MTFTLRPLADLRMPGLNSAVFRMQSLTRGERPRDRFAPRPLKASQRRDDRRLVLSITPDDWQGVSSFKLATIMPRPRLVVCTINLQIADLVESVAHSGRQRERKRRLADYSATAFAIRRHVGAGSRPPPGLIDGLDYGCRRRCDGRCDSRAGGVTCATSMCPRDGEVAQSLRCGQGVAGRS